MKPDEYDLAATAVGVVDADNVLKPDSVRVGDVVIAMGSSGLHSNGFSMVRHVLLSGAEMPLDSTVDDLDDDRPLGEVLLTPTRIYTKDCLELIVETQVRVLAHITGGGLAGNLVRVLPPTVDAVVDRSTWQVPSVFQLVAGRRGRVEQDEMERTFNMGVGMVAVVSADEPPTARSRCSPPGTCRHGRAARSSPAPAKPGWSARTHLRCFCPTVTASPITAGQPPPIVTIGFRL